MRARGAPRRTHRSRTGRPSAASCRERPSSFFSSPARNRVFSSSSDVPAASACVAATAAGPTVSVNVHRPLRQQFAQARAPPARANTSAPAPLRPAEMRAEHHARAASSERLIVGSAARIRVSSATCPRSHGHVEVHAHERAATGESAAERSRMVRVVILVSARAPARCSHRGSSRSVRGASHRRAPMKRSEVDAARGVAPLVVVPARDLHQRSVDHGGALRVERAGVRRCRCSRRRRAAPRCTRGCPCSAPVARRLEGGVDLVLRDGALHVTTRSVSDTSGVGTRIAMPSIFPFTSGITSDVAFAAPVVVGIIDTAAARARRRSLCGKSRIDWSLV